MRTRLIFVVMALAALAAFSYWRSPYHQVRSIWSVVDIEAPGSRVWQVLNDLDGYRSWNPFITSASGSIELGNTVAISLKLGGHTMNLLPRVIMVEPGKRFAWEARTFVPGVLDGRHEFEVEEIDQSHTRVIQSERFRGVLVGFLWDRFSPAITGGFRAMNDALKRRCEQSSALPAK